MSKSSKQGSGQSACQKVQRLSDSQRVKSQKSKEIEKKKEKKPSTGQVAVPCRVISLAERKPSPASSLPLLTLHFVVHPNPKSLDQGGGTPLTSRWCIQD